MILKLIVSTLPVILVLLVSEILWRKEIVQGERARKFIHILAGIWIAFWPFYIPFDGIFVLGCMALMLLFYSKFTKLFHAIYAVKRRTYGEIFYAIAIILCSYFGMQDWIFTTSILLLALADGGAAVVGRFWGINNQYLVFGSKDLLKSVAGTTSFIILAYLSIAIGWAVGGSVVINDNLFLVFAVLPFGSAIIENISPYGLDNLFTPLFATILLNSLL